MNESFYIHLEEFGKNDYTFGVLTTVESIPFSYDVGRFFGTRENVLKDITSRTIKRNEGLDFYHIKYTEPKDARIITSLIDNNDLFQCIDIEATPAVFSVDEKPSKILKDIVSKHSMQIKMFDLHKYEND